METKKINVRMITLAREARGHSQAELAEKAGLSRPSISRLELAELNLSDDLMKNITDALNFAPTLYQNNEEVIPPAMYRKRDTVPAKVLTRTDALINVYGLGISRLLKTIGFDKLNIPSLPVSVTESPEESATLTRKAWKIESGVITNLTSLLEANGIITLPVDFDSERIDSRSMLIENKYAVIFYNKRLLGDRLRFTLAFELGHLVMHTRSPLMRWDDSHEANLFAAEFLMPKEDILKDLDAELDMEKLAVLKSKWLVSMHSILYRAEDLKVITENQKRYIINRFNQLQIRRREPKELDVPVERGQLLRDLITKYRSKQKMNVKQIAEFFYMYEEEFLNTFN